MGSKLVLSAFLGFAGGFFASFSALLAVQLLLDFVRFCQLLSTIC